jgi:hypothetical protein
MRKREKKSFFLYVVYKVYIGSEKKKNRNRSQAFMIKSYKNRSHCYLFSAAARHKIDVYIWITHTHSTKMEIQSEKEMNTRRDVLSYIIMHQGVRGSYFFVDVLFSVTCTVIDVDIHFIF